MGLVEADGGLRTGDRAARRALTSSSRGSAAAESRDSSPVFGMVWSSVSRDTRDTEVSANNSGFIDQRQWSEARWRVQVSAQGMAMSNGILSERNKSIFLFQGIQWEQ